MKTSFEKFDYNTKCAAAAEAWINNTRYRVAYPEAPAALHYVDINNQNQERQLRKGAAREMKKLMRRIG